jgi:arsenite methyltransferase
MMTFRENENMDSRKTIHEDVRAYYGEKAKNIIDNAECCQPSACDCSTSYSTAALIEIPDEISSASFGCANPLVRASLAEGERVVDLGSGGGLDCFLAARQVGPSGHVIGVDMTDEMLELANANARRLNVENVSFRRGTIEDLPIDDESVDVFLSNCVINLSPDKPAVFAEMFRALVPGGRVSLADIVTRGPITDEFLSVEDGWAACVTGALTADDYAHGLTAAGFTAVQVIPADGGAWEDIPEGRPVSALITAQKPA